MDIRRVVLYLALALLAIALWDAWQQDYPQKKAPAVSTATTAKGTQSTAFVPPPFSPSATTKSSTSTNKAVKTPTIDVVKGQIISVKTGMLNVAINTNGGGLINARLPKYPKSLKQKGTPVQILTSNKNNIYIAQSGITNTTQSGKPEIIKYTTSKLNYQLQPGQDKLAVVLKGKTENGLAVTKTFTFRKGSYAITVNYQIQNLSSQTWKGSVYNQIVRRNVPVKHSFHSRSYNGAAISSPEKPYEKLDYKDLTENNISRNIKGGWIAMQQQYFLSAWVPDKNVISHYYSNVSGNAGDDGKYAVFTVGYVMPQITLAPKQTASAQSVFYVGPEIAKQLNAVSSKLKLTIDYGWFWWLAIPIFKVLQWIHKFIGNWGWSIVIITILIKLIFYKLSDKSYRSMAKMREMQPRLAALKGRYGDDKQALSKATMELYRKEKVNPMGGCLPMLVQIPVFIALYYVLIESVQLRQAPFIFWIHDLSVHDPYYVLPILMGLSMFVQQKLSPPPPDPTQAKVMMFLPIIFTVFFLTFPAGLVLYWLTNNCISVAQQYYVMKTYDSKAEKKKQQQKAKKSKSKKK